MWLTSGFVPQRWCLMYAGGPADRACGTIAKGAPIPQQKGRSFRDRLVTDYSFRSRSVRTISTTAATVSWRAQSR